MNSRFRFWGRGSFFFNFRFVSGDSDIGYFELLLDFILATKVLLLVSVDLDVFFFNAMSLAEL